jgi:stage V sporulation protein R
MDKEVKELEKALEQIWDLATGKFGLDPFPTNFEIVPATVMYEVGSYSLPGGTRIGPLARRTTR